MWPAIRAWRRRSLDGEMMIMSGRDSTLFTLNKTATILWQAADGATPLEQIVQQKICTEFEIEPDEALRDAETWRGILQATESCSYPKSQSSAEIRNERIAPTDD